MLSIGSFNVRLLRDGDPDSDHHRPLHDDLRESYEFSVRWVSSEIRSLNRNPIIQMSWYVLDCKRFTTLSLISCLCRGRHARFPHWIRKGGSTCRMNLIEPAVRAIVRLLRRVQNAFCNVPNHADD